MADISKITLPSNNTYDIKDATARSGLANKITAPSSPSDGDVLTYDNANSTWIAAAPSGGGLPSQSASTNGYYLRSNGTSGAAWVEPEAATELSIDSTPTEDSDNLVTSGGVWDALQNAGSGSVTSVGISNATNGGLSVSGSPITSSGTITIGHSNVLTNAQTTEAVYPIKIDKNGHISSYGSAVTIPDVSGKIDTAGTGLSKSGTTLNHSNSVTAQATSAVYPITIDAQGHIASYGSAVTIPSVASTSSLLKGNGSGGAVAATAGTDYQAPLTIDATPTDGNTTHVVSSDGTYDKIMARTKIYTATCTTGAEYADKIATLDDDSGFSLTSRTIVAVRFTDGNTATTPTLRVDGANVGTGTAKTIALPSGSNTYTTGNGSTYNTWGTYETILFMYNGLYWINTGSGLLSYLAYNLADSKIPTPSSASSGDVLTYNGSSWAASTPAGGLPSQTGNSGKYLTTDGSSASWGAATSAIKLSIDNTPTSASNNLVKSGGVYTAINDKVNRTTAVNAADTNYTTLMARGAKLLDSTTFDAVSDWSTHLVNGTIAWCYE